MLADRLVELRKLAGASSAEVDRLTELSVGYCAQIEGGKKKNPTVDTVKAIASILGSSFGYLAAGEGKPPSATKARRAFALAQRRNQKGKR